MPQKNNLIFILIFISGLSQAVHLSQNEMGQVLILPYYTVNNGFDTLMTITNTKDQAKAVRVRFREAANNRAVFEFNLYLGVKDVWTGALIKNSSGNTDIISIDKSCTIPSLANGPLNFSNDNYTGDMADGYGDDLMRLNEGFIEIIEMGNVAGDSARAIKIAQDSDADCSAIEGAWLTNGYWFNDASIDMLPLSGGLIADAVLINVAKGMSLSEKATAISDFSDEILHYNVNNDSPNLTDGKTTSTIIDKKGFKHDLQWQTGFEALSSVITKSTIYNEYATTESIGANTDWILTMPTKQYYIDPIYSSNLNVSPFNENFMSDLGLACQDAVGSAYSRDSEESIFDIPQFPVGLPPPPPPPPPPESYYKNGLCWSTNTVSFTHDPNIVNIYAGASKVFIENYTNHVGIFDSNYNIMNGNKGASVLISDFDTGIANIDLPQTTSRNMNTSGSPVEVVGLPIIGFSVQQYVNGSIGNNVLANYAGYFNHKFKIEIIDPDVNLTDFAPMQLSQDGVGQALLYPYYSVRNDMNTLFTVVNTSTDAKNLLISFKDGMKSSYTFSMNVFLAPHDVWTAALVPHVIEEGDIVGSEMFVGGNGTKLITNDKSCTLPAIVNNQVFTLHETGADAEDIERSQEGMIQVFDIGTLTNESAQAVSFNQGEPNDCSYLLNESQTKINPLLTIQTPNGEGEIYGSVSLINVQQGIDMSYDSVAIKNFSNDIPSQFGPPTDLSSAQNRTLIETEDGLIQTTWDNGVDAVSALLMHKNVINDYTIETSINGQTDFVWAFPTMNFYEEDPFNYPSYFPIENEFALDAYNREQLAGTLESFPIPTGVAFIFNTFKANINVTSFANTSEQSDTIFDSKNHLIDFSAFCSTVTYPCYPIDIGFRYLPFAKGWFEINYRGRPRHHQEIDLGYLIGSGENDEVHKLYGIPSLGFVAQQYKNGTLVGVNTLANYGLIKMNKYSKQRMEITDRVQ